MRARLGRRGSEKKPRLAEHQADARGQLDHDSDNCTQCEPRDCFKEKRHDMDDTSVDIAPQSAHCLGELICLVRNTLQGVQGPKILWFRGEQDATWDLLPRIWRKYDGSQYYNERNFTNRFRSSTAVS